MRRRSSVLVATAGLMAMASAGAAWSAGVGRAGIPQTRPVTAQFSTDPPSVADHTECQGVDGMYDSFHYVYSGTETSGYALLSGDVTFELFGLTNVTTNDGYMSGTWTLTDPNTGQLKGKGHIDAVTSGVDTKGVIVGSLGTSGVTLVANYASVTSSQNTLSGEFGASPSIIDLDPAVMAKGSCR